MATNTKTWIHVGAHVLVDLDGTPMEGIVLRVAGESADWYYDTYLIDFGDSMAEAFLPSKILEVLPMPRRRGR